MSNNNINTTEQDSATPPWLFVLVGITLVFIGAVPLKEVDLPFLNGIELHIGKTVSNIGVVLMFIQVLDKFFYRPLSDAISERTKKLEKNYREAESLKSEMSRMKNEYDIRLSESESKAREQIQAYVREAQVLREQLIDEATTKASEMIKQAQSQIESEKAFVQNELKVHAIEMTLKATEKIIKENMDTKKNRAMIEDFIENFESVHS